MSGLFSDEAGGPPSQVVPLSEMQPGQVGDCFALLVSKERSTTRDGKPYFRVSFRDATRTVTAMIWSDSAFFADCEAERSAKAERSARAAWQPGRFYKLRCRFDETQYGPQIELDRIRETTDADAADGFDPAGFFERTRFDPAEMFAELLQIAKTKITEPGLGELIVGLLQDNEEAIKRAPAASRNHHAFVGGYLEHVLSVTRTAVYLAEKYADYYADMQPPLNKSLVVAGAVVHDIGKLAELELSSAGPQYTPQGRLIGHILLGRDMVRRKAAGIGQLEPETLLRLEHIIVSHQNLPEWGSPIAPHTPEALLVYFADDLDAKFHMLARALEQPPQQGEPFTGRDNPLRRQVFRGLTERSRDER